MALTQCSKMPEIALIDFKGSCKKSMEIDQTCQHKIL